MLYHYLIYQLLFCHVACFNEGATYKAAQGNTMSVLYTMIWSRWWWNLQSSGQRIPFTKAETKGKYIWWWSSSSLEPPFTESRDFLAVGFAFRSILFVKFNYGQDGYYLGVWTCLVKEFNKMQLTRLIELPSLLTWSSATSLSAAFALCDESKSSTILHYMDCMSCSFS